MDEQLTIFGGKDAVVQEAEVGHARFYEVLHVFREGHHLFLRKPEFCSAVLSGLGLSLPDSPGISSPAIGGRPSGLVRSTVTCVNPGYPTQDLRQTHQPNDLRR